MEIKDRLSGYKKELEESIISKTKEIKGNKKRLLEVEKEKKGMEDELAQLSDVLENL